MVGLLCALEGGAAMLAPAQAQLRSEDGAIALPQRYWDAVEDARTPEPQEIFRGLTAITPHNPALRWNDQGQLLVATWTNWSGYSQNIGNQLILTRDLWVTAVPDLQLFCKHYRPTAETSLAARLNQLLGLPPEVAEVAATRRVVELWVDPQFLFRPSPDPEITDYEAELHFRPSTEFVSVSPSYRHWFYAQYDQRYQHNGLPMTRSSAESANVVPYPWTQLGYTYDWGNAADWSAVDSTRPAQVGLSEFVIRQWSPISVHITQELGDYCH
ncbi:hypothetical protein [Leptolyngbya sp. AN02str]|uniref:hypothetical protein n=1 Tax=Leptolyngbya sp. AN02str TaxID=3423363 RepID=UPI003D31BD95